MDKEFLRRLMSEASGFQTPSPGTMSSWEMLDKFAEVIVREAADVASWSQDMKEADIGAEVLAHFGFEPEEEKA